MIAGFMASKPLGPYFDFVWVHYADWCMTTPMLLLDLAMLAGMGKPEVFLLCFFDVLMIGSGYGSQVAYTSEGMWPLYIYSCSEQPRSRGFAGASAAAISPSTSLAPIYTHIHPPTHCPSYPTRPAPPRRSLRAAHHGHSHDAPAHAHH